MTWLNYSILFYDEISSDFYRGVNHLIFNCSEFYEFVIGELRAVPFKDVSLQNLTYLL